MVKLIDARTVNAVLEWPALIDALAGALASGEGVVGDRLLESGKGKFLTRSAWLEGVALGVKAVSIYPANPMREPPLPAIQGLLILCDEATGAPVAAVDGAAVTAWKTAADSALGSRLLSRADSRRFLMVGAGSMAEPLVRAHLAVRPSIERVALWNRTSGRAEALRGRLGDLPRDVTLADDLAAAVREADIVCCATMSETPLVEGRWLAPGCHLDLVGAYTPTMREADDEALRRGRLFVDSRRTTIGEIGELMLPMASGALSESDVIADLPDLLRGVPGRRAAEEITVFKNGGGAHLDVIVARAVLDRLAARGGEGTLPGQSDR